MRVKVAIFSLSRHLIDLAVQLQEELDVEIIVKNVVFQEAGVEAQKLEEEGVEAILARGLTFQEISRATTIPIVHNSLTTLDLLRTLHTIDYGGKRIGIADNIINPNNFNEIIQEVKKLIKIDLFAFCYRDKDSLLQALNEIKSQGVNFILGGAFVVRVARDMGFEGTELKINRETLLERLVYARQLAMVKRREEREARWLKTILDLTNESIIATDGNGVVTNINSNAVRLLNTGEDKIVNQNISDYISEMAAVVRNRKARVGDIINVGDKKVVMHFRPVNIRREYMGGILSLEKVSDIQKLEQQIRKKLYEKGLVAKTRLENIIGSSPIMQQTMNIAKKYGRTSFNILINGESGTGKELFAQGLHLISPRNHGPFVAVNCGALPESLLESELFGYEGGAFTGARREGKLGLFELAHGGTIFLDEISSMTQSLQARLLRVIQEKELLRLGGDKIIPIDVRIISATNEDVSRKIREKEFRGDLFYRINELNLKIPPLSSRTQDIPELVRYFIDKVCLQESVRVDVDALYQQIINFILSDLKNYPWPGNVRELENLVKRSVVLYDNENSFLEAKELLVSADEEEDEHKIFVSLGKLCSMEEELIRKVYEQVGYNKIELANVLGISRTTLWRRFKAMDLDR